MTSRNDFEENVDAWDAGVEHAVQLLAGLLKVDDWVAADGSEDYDQDLGDTMMNIIKAKGLYNDEDGSWATLSVGAQGQPSDLISRTALLAILRKDRDGYFREHFAQDPSTGTWEASNAKEEYLEELDERIEAIEQFPSVEPVATGTDEYSDLADRYQAGTDKALKTGYDEFGPKFRREREMVVTALRAYAKTHTDQVCLKAHEPQLVASILQYARDLRRNSSGSDDYPWGLMRGVADELDRLVSASSVPPQQQPDWEATAKAAQSAADRVKRDAYVDPAKLREPMGPRPRTSVSPHDSALADRLEKYARDVSNSNLGGSQHTCDCDEAARLLRASSPQESQPPLWRKRVHDEVAAMLAQGWSDMLSPAAIKEIADEIADALPSPTPDNGYLSQEENAEPKCARCGSVGDFYMQCAGCGTRAKR